MNSVHLDQTLSVRYRLSEPLALVLAICFVLITFAASGLATGGVFTLGTFWPALAWTTVVLAAFWLLHHFQPRHDPFLLPVVALLSGWGLTLISRLAPNFLERQLVWITLGLGLMTAIAVLPHSLRPLRRYRYTLLLVGLFLLGTTLVFGVNPSGFGAALWLPIPFVGQVFFQPSELLKLLLVIFFASYFDERESLLQTPRDAGRFARLPFLAPLLVMWGFCIVLLVWQRDLGAATLFFLLFLALLYLATGDRRTVIGGLLLLLLGGVFAYFAFDVVALRVEAWWNPWPDADNRAFQIVQSLYALAAGGMLGTGVGQGFPIYIPVVHSDFAFAAVAEEWGLVGSLTVVICFMVVTQRGMLITMRASRPFRRYLAAGITILLVSQALLIMGGVTKLLPLTGVTLPFLSYGGSSLVISSLMIGLLLFLSANETPSPGRVTLRPAFAARVTVLTVVLLVSLLLIVASLLYWSVLRADAILAREDNPRLVEAELRILRGEILDRNGQTLARTEGSGNELSRIYPIGLSSPAVGYYSFRYGTSGIEEGYDTVLRGDTESLPDTLSRQWLHETQRGQSVQLTLDADLQTTAEALLGEQDGAILIVDLQTGDVLTMVSHPTYDPNQLDAQFDSLLEAENAPFFNRAVQGQYQPGANLFPFVLAAALSDEPVIRSTEIEVGEPISIAGQRLNCAAPLPEAATWKDALVAQCPAPFQDVGNALGEERLTAVFDYFNLGENPDLPINTETSAIEPLSDPGLAAIGHDTLSITPLQLLLAFGRLATLPESRQPRLVQAVQAPDGSWLKAPLPAPAEDGSALISESAAASVLSTLQQEKTIDYSTLVLSGPEGSTNAWYVGLAPPTSPRYGIVVVAEDSDTTQAARRLGRALLARLP